MVEKANIKDTKDIHKLIGFAAKKGGVLPRALSDIYENIRDFFVFRKNKKVIGCCALHIVWEDLAEIRSLVVRSRYRGKGVARELINKATEEAKMLGIKKIFVLTNQDKFFKKLGFKKVRRDVLPHKIWADCINCPKFPECDEVPFVFRV